MKIALGQINVIANNIQANMESIQSMVEAAKAQNATLIVFPEMTVGGYFVGDKWNDDEWVAECSRQNEVIKELSDGIGIIWGNVSLDYQGKTYQGHDGRTARFNSVFFAYNKMWVQKENGQSGQSIKHLFPNYRMFEDARFFTSGLTLKQWDNQIDDASPFIFEVDQKKLRIFLQVCEDLWDEDYPYSPTEQAVKAGSDWIVNVSSSVWTLNKEYSRQKQVIKKAKLYKSAMPNVVYVNACGMQNNGKNVLLFDGGSAIYRGNGDLFFQGNDDFNPSCHIVSTENATISKRTEHKLLNGLLAGIRYFDQQVFPHKPKWIIGLSGGLDSSINAALFTLALGKDRMVGVNMSTKYNSEKTIMNAKVLAMKCQMTYLAGSIEPMVNATLDTMKAMNQNPPYTSLTVENIQARLRGHLLSSLASTYQAIIVNNGNKVETALGYCTLYGDTIGALSPIGDLTKMQLFLLAKEINEMVGDEWISHNLLPVITEGKMVWDMAPSAELKEKQIDPMKWGYHDWLISYLTDYPGHRIESFMRMILSGDIKHHSVYSWMEFYGLTDPHRFMEDLQWVLRLMHTSVFKRIQMPPVITVSRGSFGFDYRESQLSFQPTSQFLELKEAILRRKTI